MLEPTNPRPQLQTPRLILRAAEPTDLNDFHEMFSNAEVMRYWSCAPHTDAARTKSYLDQMIASPTNGVLDFVIVVASTGARMDMGKVVGKVGIWSVEKGELGFMLNWKVWGGGFMKEALGRLLLCLWDKGVERVVADVDPRNEGSIGLLKGFGFVETGREKGTGSIGGVGYDSVYLALKRAKG